MTSGVQCIRLLVLNGVDCKEVQLTPNSVKNGPSICARWTLSVLMIGLPLFST